MMNRFFSVSVFVLLMFLLWLPKATLAEPLVVITPSGSSTDIRTDYFLSVLRLSLEKSGVPFSVIVNPSAKDMTHTRKKISVANGQLSVVWDGAKKTWDENLVPIKIPIFGGINGYRIFLANKNLKNKLSQVNSLNDLRSFSVGFGIGWAGEEIFIHNGFKTVHAKYAKLFKMLNEGRFDIFSRGIQEAFGEIKKYGTGNPHIFIEESIGVYQASYIYFYVHKNNQALFNAIETGLLNAFSDGSFKKFFLTRPEIMSAIQDGKIKERNWFGIQNPFIADNEFSRNSEYLKSMGLMDF